MTETQTQRTRYGAVAMVLHWSVAALMIFMIFFGEDLMRANGLFQPSLHVSIGTSILVLSVLRQVWRLMNPPPALPATMAPWEIMVTKVTHSTFYILMIGLPITGWLAFPEQLARHPAMAGVSVFGLFAVPPAPGLGQLPGLLHSFGSNVGMALVLLHVLAALKHQFVNRDGLMRRMLPL